MATLTFTHANELSQLHDEILAVHPTLKGVLRCEGLGDQIRLTFPDDIADPGLAAIIAAHVPKSAAEREAVLRNKEFDAAKLMKAVVLEILDEIDARHPANLVDRAAFRANVLDRYKAL